MPAYPADAGACQKRGVERTAEPQSRRGVPRQSRIFVEQPGGGHVTGRQKGVAPRQQSVGLRGCRARRVRRRSVGPRYRGGGGRCGGGNFRAHPDRRRGRGLGRIRGFVRMGLRRLRIGRGFRRLGCDDPRRFRRCRGGVRLNCGGRGCGVAAALQKNKAGNRNAGYCHRAEGREHNLHHAARKRAGPGSLSLIGRNRRNGRVRRAGDIRFISGRDVGRELFGAVRAGSVRRCRFGSLRFLRPANFAFCGLRLLGCTKVCVVGRGPIAGSPYICLCSAPTSPSSEGGSVAQLSSSDRFPLCRCRVHHAQEVL